MIPDVPSPAKMARQTEDEFWSAVPEYDGVVRGALSQRHILFLIIPSMHTAFLYTIDNNKLSLTSWRNIAVDLYVTANLNSSPSSKELLRQLPQEIREEYEETIAEKEEEKKGSADFSVDLATLDPWIRPIKGARFVFFEPANARVLLYSIKDDGIELMSMRNMAVDLLIPASAHPENETLYQNYLSAMKRLRRTPYTKDELKAMMDVKAVKNSGASKSDSGVQASLSVNERELVIDFQKKRKVVVIRPVGAGNGIELTDVYDYSIQVGVSIAEAEIYSENHAEKMLKNAVKYARRKNTKSPCYVDRANSPTLQSTPLRGS